MRKRKYAPMPETLKPLLKRLNSRDETAREQAFQEALALPPELLLRLLEPEAKRARVHECIEDVAGGSCCLWGLTCFVTMLAQFAYGTAFLLWDALLFLFIPGLFSVFRNLSSRNQLHSLLSRAILSQSDVRFVAPALLFFRHSQVGFYKELQQTLLRLLPQVTPADVEAWTPKHKAVLRQQLVCHNLEMLECTLQTLERVGNADDIPDVRHIAGITPEQMAAEIRPNMLAEDRRELYRAILNSVTIDPKLHGLVDPENTAVMLDLRYEAWCLNRAREIHTLANRSLTTLQARSGQQQQAEVLLRASQSDNSGAAQVLLRPQLESHSETPPEQLLRPNTSKS